MGVELRGEGYCVGPGFEVSGRMIFELVDKGSVFVLIVREDKKIDLTEATRRREFGVQVDEKDLQELSSWLSRRLSL